MHTNAPISCGVPRAIRINSVLTAKAEFPKIATKEGLSYWLTETSKMLTKIVEYLGSLYGSEIP